MSQGYTKTTIIECARSQSEEAQNNNNAQPAQWTNRCGTGFQLKPGDTISVHSSFVSELGAEAGQIQIKGEELGVEVEVEHINVEKLLYDKNLPEKYHLENASLVKTKIKVRDDTLHWVVSPYKCANGENYTFLPRNYAGLKTGDGTPHSWVSFDETPYTGHPTGFNLGSCPHARPTLNMCLSDVELRKWPAYSSATIPTKVAGYNDGARYTIFKAKQTFYAHPTAVAVSILGKAHSGSPIIDVNAGESTSNILLKMEIDAPDYFPSNASVIAKTDTTITMSANAIDTSPSHHPFLFSIAASESDSFLPPTTANSSYNASECLALRDPAILGDYIQVKELLELKVNPGYNAPTDVATQLTEELNERTDIEFLSYDLTKNSQSASNQVLSFKTETPTYKLYHCATATSFNSSNLTEFEKVNGSWNADKAYQYLMSYQHIGIKRPELYVAGKELNASTGFITEERDYTRSQDRVFNTTISWTKENILKFKKFFDTQAIYPELFDEYYQEGTAVSATRTRFLHMNLYDDGPNEPAEINYPSDFPILKDERVPKFGYDYYQSAVGASQGTFPLFIDYNPETEGLSENDVGYTDYGPNYGTITGEGLEANYNDLAYGFARKIRRQLPVAPGGVYYTIGFQFTQTGGTIPSIFLQPNNSYKPADYQIGTAGGRRFGFDYHFSAYGTMAMVLYNGNTDDLGRNRSNYSQEEYALWQNNNISAGIGLDPYKFGVYLGADQPLFNYSEAQQRFQVEYLHCAEREGQIYNAGGYTAAGEQIPSNGNGDQECYKINKVMLPNNYTPEIAPYDNTFNASLNGMGTPVSVSHINGNVKPFSIMDAHSGLFIENWIVPEEYWDRALVGIMGFRYNQFHNPNSLSSRQVRIKAHGANADLHNVNVITTNADINEGDLINYSMEVQNQETFQITNTIPKSVITNPNSASEQARQIYPVIVSSPVESIKITAERLPTKTLRPYYTIRSDIIEENGYLGGARSGITLPIVSVTNKANPYGDFLNGMGGDIVFTNTIDRVLTRIRCSIHEPNGQLARCDLNSAIIFKINQQVNADLSLVSTLLQSKNKQDQIEGEYAEEGPDYSKTDYSQAFQFK